MYPQYHIIFQIWRSKIDNIFNNMQFPLEAKKHCVTWLIETKITTKVAPTQNRETLDQHFIQLTCSVIPMPKSSGLLGKHS